MRRLLLLLLLLLPGTAAVLLEGRCQPAHAAAAAAVGDSLGGCQHRIPGPAAAAAEDLSQKMDLTLDHRQLLLLLRRPASRCRCRCRAKPVCC
jgi:hypothetical protein